MCCKKDTPAASQGQAVKSDIRGAAALHTAQESAVQLAPVSHIDEASPAGADARPVPHLEGSAIEFRATNNTVRTLHDARSCN